jgi:hypothetical protein
MRGSRRSLPRSLPIFLSLLAAALAAAPRAGAQSAVPRGESAALRPGDALLYDLSLSVGWRIDSIPDPLHLTSRLALEVAEDTRAAPDGAGRLVLDGRLEVSRASYEGPSGRWNVDPRTQSARATIREIWARLLREDGAGPYAGRVAHAEELLGVAAAELGGRAFRAEVLPDRVVVTAKTGDRLVPGLGGEAEDVLRSYLAEAVRFALPAVERREAAALVCDGVPLRSRPVTSERYAGRAIGATVGRVRDLPTGVAFSLEALLGARYGAAAAASGERPDGLTSLRGPAGARPLGLLDLQVAGGAAQAEASERVSFADGAGFVLARQVQVGEDVTGASSGGGRVRVQAKLRWEGALRDARLANGLLRERRAATLGLPESME